MEFFNNNIGVLVCPNPFVTQENAEASKSDSEGYWYRIMFSSILLFMFSSSFSLLVVKVPKATGTYLVA
jgi:hypothetical protein